MAVKIALAVGLFIAFCILPDLKASTVVQDGLIYTEVKKTLVRGVQGVLTCRFYGKPFAVYWGKGLDPDDLSLMASWFDGEVSGPRFDDGSCDVDENYSLIINNVSTIDAGRIYCRVANDKGVLLQNYTDILVVDIAITTNPQVTLQLRQATYGTLQCTVHVNARRVSWKKGTTSATNERLVVLVNNRGVAERSGVGYDDGTYNITQDYSLVIKKLQIHHEGLYVCEVTDDTGISFRNHTFVNVVAQPLEPFPTIQDCPDAEQHDSSYCILVAKSGMTLTCQAVKYYPSINLVFLYGSKALEPSDTREWNNKDRTKNKTITIATRGNKELYTCVAYSIPGTNANKSTSVLLQGDEPLNSTLVIILVVFAALALIFSVVYFIWRKKQRHYSAVLHWDLADIVGMTDLTRDVFQVLKKRVDEVLMQHHLKIFDLIETKSTIQADHAVIYSSTALFDINKMLVDWHDSPTSTRSKETIDIANEPDYAWPSDEELKIISHHLTQESMKKVCQKLNIDCPCDDASDKGKRFKALRKWRTKASLTPLKEIWKQLFSVLESNNLGGLLPTLIETYYIYKAELVDLAFHLLINDLFPFAKELGINVTKLVSYRTAFHPSHLGMGTIKLLTELLASIVEEDNLKRSIFYSKITELSYEDVARRGVFEYGMSYGELCSISEAISQNREGRVDQGATYGMLPGPGIPEELDDLQDVLQLTDRDLADGLDTTHPLTAYALFKIWKEKPRPSVFNYRAALAHELRRINMPGLADEIVAGKYINEKTSPAFIEDMVWGLNQDQLSSLWKLLNPGRTGEHWHTSTPFDAIYVWVAEWTTDMKAVQKYSDIHRVTRDVTMDVPGSTVLGCRMAEAALIYKHRDLNDKLVEHGFLDLAREIMIIEQRIAWF